MKEILNSLSSNEILIFAILIFVFGLVLLSYLLTLITTSKRRAKIIEFEKKETEKSNNELEEMLGKMKKTLDEKEKLDTVSDFEEEQEINAIISYQELLKAAKKDFPNVVKNEKIEEFTKIEEIKPKLNIVEETSVVEEEPKKFKGSVFISPIYGVSHKNSENDINQEYIQQPKYVNIENNEYDRLEYEKIQNEQFLEDLKNFRNSL